MQNVGLQRIHNYTYVIVRNFGAFDRVEKAFKLYKIHNDMLKLTTSP
jgi:hypothetical protein